jgi:Family of unknown function (DUF6496)
MAKYSRSASKNVKSAMHRRKKSTLIQEPQAGHCDRAVGGA